MTMMWWTVDTKEEQSDDVMRKAGPGLTFLGLTTHWLPVIKQFIDVHIYLNELPVYIQIFTQEHRISRLISMPHWVGFDDNIGSNYKGISSWLR